MTLLTREDGHATGDATDLHVRDAIEADLPSIVRIYNEAIATRISTAQLEPVTVAERRDWIASHSPDRYPFWVAELEKQIAAWLTLKPFLPRCAYAGTAEVSVYVDQPFRGRGVGRSLLEEAVARAPRLDITAMVGLIFAHNHPSLRLFARVGFEGWGHLPGIALIEGLRRDVTIMGRHT